MIYTRISPEAVFNFLKSRNSTIDFSRDGLSVEVLPDTTVVVVISDRVSGGATTHVSGLDPLAFEAKYNS